MQIMIEDGFTIHNGHLTFNKRYNRSVQRERVCRTDDRYNYRDGWELPAMPK